MIDAEGYFESAGIECHTAGEKNVSRGWVGIQCPFCNDHSWHLGVHLESGAFHCHRCKEKGSFAYLIKILEQCEWPQAYQKAKKFHGSTPSMNEGSFVPPGALFVNLDACFCVNPWPILHKKYLEGRNFDPDFLIRKYHLKATGNSGEYKFRIIIPVHINKRLVTFTSRDVTGLSRARYKAASREKSILPVSSCLYNVDSVKDKALIVEGPTDVWRIGDGCVATFGTSYTQDQVSMLVRTGARRFFVMFDPEETAQQQARKLAYDLASVKSQVEILELPGGNDPGSLDYDSVLSLRREIGL
ncbi:MAG: toprim domain-containing protein [Gammaproteobacteria bacterium]|nr:toprim domain-containing protein [Gammaproteobacteria bacterium]